MRMVGIHVCPILMFFRYIKKKIYKEITWVSFTSVDFILEERDFACFDPDLNKWIVDSETFMIEIGSSSRDIRLSRCIEVENPTKLIHKLRKDCGFHELLVEETAKSMFWDFLIRHGLLLREQITPETEQKLQKSFFSVRAYMDSKTSAISFELLDELIQEINNVLDKEE